MGLVAGTGVACVGLIPKVKELKNRVQGLEKNLSEEGATGVKSELKDVKSELKDVNSGLKDFKSELQEFKGLFSSAAAERRECLRAQHRGLSSLWRASKAAASVAAGAAPAFAAEWNPHDVSAWLATISMQQCAWSVQPRTPG